MSKLLLVLCLIVGSYTANASVTDTVKEKIEVAKEKLMELIKSAYETVQHAVAKAKDTLVDWSEKAQEKAAEIIKDVSDKIDEALKKLDEKIDEWAGKAGDGVDVTECTKLADEAREAAVNVVANASACASDKIAEGTGYVEDINRITDNLFAELAVVSDDAAKCFNDVDGFNDAAHALACLTKQVGKAVVTVAYEVPGLVEDIAKLTYAAITIIPSMGVCSFNATVDTVLENLDKIGEQIQACIDQKIADSTSTTSAAVTSPASTY